MSTDISTLSDTDVLATVIRISGVSEAQATYKAQRLLAEYGNLYHLAHRDPAELVRYRYISRRQAIRLQVALELGTRSSTPPLDAVPFPSSSGVAAYYIPRMQSLKREVFKVLLLNARNALIKEVTISEGSLTASIVHPREVFRPAIIEGAVSIICIHNHPSGCPEPSQDDIKITQQLAEAGKMIDIRMLDHLIIGHRTFVSLASRGLL